MVQPAIYGSLSREEALYLDWVDSGARQECKEHAEAAAEAMLDIETRRGGMFCKKNFPDSQKLQEADADLAAKEAVRLAAAAAKDDQVRVWDLERSLEMDQAEMAEKARIAQVEGARKAAAQEDCLAHAEIMDEIMQDEGRKKRRKVAHTR
jgi:hypothetical protein